MVINRVIFCVAALLSMLNISTINAASAVINAASAVGGSDDDVLLLTQISQTLSCVSPLAQQKDGLSRPSSRMGKYRFLFKYWQRIFKNWRGDSVEY